MHKIISFVHEESKQPVDYKLKVEVIKLNLEFISGTFQLSNGEIITESKEKMRYSLPEIFDYWTQ
jgi:hypothetical protein